MCYDVAINVLGCRLTYLGRKRVMMWGLMSSGVGLTYLGQKRVMMWGLMSSKVGLTYLGQKRVMMWRLMSSDVGLTYFGQKRAMCALMSSDVGLSRVKHQLSKEVTVSLFVSQSQRVETAGALAGLAAQAPTQRVCLM